MEAMRRHQAFWYPIAPAGAFSRALRWAVTGRKAVRPAWETSRASTPYYDVLLTIGFCLSLALSSSKVWHRLTREHKQGATMQKHALACTRRVLLGGAVAVAGLAQRASHAAANGATFVLVHGAWHGGWCWQRVSDLLTRQGHTVHAPTLTGVGERSHLSSPSINLTTHVLDIVNEVKWKDLNNFVLCGHSYGGMVITGAAEQIGNRISSIVYLDAFLPENGQSLDEIVGSARPAINGMIAPITAAQFSVNLADRAWVDSKTTPQSAACWSEKLSVTGAVNRIPKKTYVISGITPMAPFRALHDRLSADPSWQTHVVAGAGHDIMIDKPAELARILAQAALRAG